MKKCVSRLFLVSPVVSEIREPYSGQPAYNTFSSHRCYKKPFRIRVEGILPGGHTECFPKVLNPCDIKRSRNL